MCRLVYFLFPIYFIDRICPNPYYFFAYPKFSKNLGKNNCEHTHYYHCKHIIYFVASLKTVRKCCIQVKTEKLHILNPLSAENVHNIWMKYVKRGTKTYSR